MFKLISVRDVRLYMTHKNLCNGCSLGYGRENKVMDEDIRELLSFMSRHGRLKSMLSMATMIVIIALALYINLAEPTMMVRHCIRGFMFFLLGLQIGNACCMIYAKYIYEVLLVKFK
jgi:hypothetical protein